LPLSLVLKEMNLPTHTYEGSPVQPVSVASASAGMHHAPRAPAAAPAVDNTDWLKTAAIIFVLADHFGHFFMEDDRWWSVAGRLAAPIFFFLMGYAQSRTVPLHWVWLGIILTLLDSWNSDWAWVAPNILLSLAFIRMARPHSEILLQRHGWTAFAFLVCALLAMLAPAAKLVDYGAEGWLWALFGLCQRRYVDGRSAADGRNAAQAGLPPPHVAAENALRLLACLIAAAVYIWQEQREYSFPQAHLTVLMVGVGMLSLALCLFERGRSPVQPPRTTGGVLRFIGRHTLEIYAIQLAGSELLVKLLPGLAP